jgi:hypothetical protein
VTGDEYGFETCIADGLLNRRRKIQILVGNVKGDDSIRPSGTRFPWYCELETTDARVTAEARRRL